jgi:Uma2 family endonuclease
MTANLATQPPAQPMTVEEFLDWPGDGQPGKHELVDGLVRAQAAPSADHGTIQANLARHIGNHLAAAGSKCRVITEAPVVPRFKPAVNARVPDLAVECAPPSTSRVLVSPLLIVEVLSPTNVDETWDAIRAVANLPTVKEVLVVSSMTVSVEVFEKDSQGGWPAEAVPVEILAGSVHLASIDLTLQLADIYAGTLLAT